MKGRLTLRFFLNITLLEGGISCIWLLFIPGDPKSAWVLGVSKIRLALLGGMLLALVLLVWLAYKANRDSGWYQRFEHKTDQLLQKNIYSAIGTMAACLGFVAGLYLLCTAFTTTDLFIKGYLTRLAPWIFWLSAICGQAFLLISLRNAESWGQNLRENKDPIVFFGIVFFISLVVFQVTNFRIEHWNKLPDAAYGIITGKPHWRAYSNRLLGPYTIYLISQLGFSFETALVIFNFLMIWAQNTILYSLLLKTTKNAFGVSLRYIIYFSFFFIVLQDYYSYPWDYIDSVIFTIFAWGILRRKPATYFVILFLVELLNREIALFISLYLIIDALKINHAISKTRTYQEAPVKRPIRSLVERLTITDRRKLSVGVLLSLAGAFYTKSIRDLLFIESSLDNVGADISNKLIGNHLHLVVNIKDLFFYNLTSLNFINSIFVFGVIAYLLLSLPRFDEAHRKAFIIVVMILISILVFGLINETRMFIILIPFLLFFHLELRDSAMPISQ